jgi:SAM-dependent methyltransferase
MTDIAEHVAAEVAARWNGETGLHWVEEVDGFDALLDPMGRAVLDAAGLVSGQRVLEVGSGTGQMTIQAARMVEPGGSVVGVDVSGPMADFARRRARVEGAGNADFVVADAATVDLPEAAFDVLTSRFGLMFFADPAPAFTHLVNRVKPGGRIAFVVWQEMERSELFAVPAAVIASVAPHLAVPPPVPGAPGPFSLGDPARLEALLVCAGAGDICVERLQRRLRVGAGIAEAIDFVMRSSSLDAVRGDGALQQRVERELRRALADHTGPAGVELTGAAWLVSARRPAGGPAEGE